MSDVIYSHEVGMQINGLTKAVMEIIREGDMPTAHIPDYEFRENGQYEWKLYFAHDSSPRLNISALERNASVVLPEQRIWDIIKLCNLLSERSFQENGLYSVHAAAFELNGNGVLVLGESMAGKSTLLLEVLGHYGANLIGTEQVIVSEQHLLVGGTRSIASRKGSFDFFHKDLKNRIKKIHKSGRLLFDAESLGVREVHNIPLKVVLYPKVTVVHAPEKYEINRNTKKYLLGKNLGEGIHGLDSICDQTVPLQSLDTSEIRYRRLQTANHIAESIPFFLIAGTPSSILENVLEEL